MKKIQGLQISVAVIVVVLALLPIIGGATGNNSDQKGGRPGPPPEAFKACEGKQEGDSVSFTGRQGEALKSTCQTINGMLVAVPEGHTPGQRPEGN